MATTGSGEAPRAMIHKRILDSAKAQPEASMEALAAEVAGASPSLVERVLEEYGDPGLEDSAIGSNQEATMTEHATAAAEAALTDKQREALRAIAAHPEATQEALAEHLGVSRATVNKRVNGIEGFEWQDRRAFVEAALDEAVLTTRSPVPAAEEDPTAAAASDGGQLLAADADGAIEQLQERLARLERQVDAEGGRALGDAALTAKVVRAVVADDAITEDEELRVLEALL